MRVNWTDDGWRKRFAILPLFLRDGPNCQMVWLEPYWSRFCGDYYSVSLTNPRPSNP
jgi:hypothetical protein